MSTFTIITSGIITKNILVLISSTSSSCSSRFYFEVTGKVGDSITLTFTDDTGQGNFKPVINNKGIDSPYTFTSNGTEYLTIYAANTGAVEATQYTISAVNNTTGENDSQSVTRNSTGITC